MYPVEWCFRPDPAATCWFHWFTVDASFYFSTLFVVSAIQDVYFANMQPDSVTPNPDLSKRFSPQTTYYLRRTIELLQGRLVDRKTQLEDVTIATVVSLAMVADAAGDQEGAKAHVNGLRQMVRLRGGIKGMMSNHHIVAKLCR